jgi:hypothetical protein
VWQLQQSKIAGAYSSLAKSLSLHTKQIRVGRETTWQEHPQFHNILVTVFMRFSVTDKKKATSCIYCTKRQFSSVN